MNRREAFKKTALMAGVAMSGSMLTSLLQSCQEQKRLDWVPVFFNEKQAMVISEITETILPKTDTPGAKDLNVDIFVDAMFKKTLSPEDQKHVFEGYEKFIATCQDMFDKTFIELNEEERHQVLQKVEKDSNKFNPSVWGSTIGKQDPLDFYRRVKQFTLVGYYTSEQIGKNVLVYDPIPGEQKGCIPLSDVGNAWTL